MLAMVTFLGVVSLVILGIIQSGRGKACQDGSGSFPDGAEPPTHIGDITVKCADNELNRAELDAALNKALAPLLARIDCASQRQNQASGYKPTGSPVDPHDNVGCREVEDLLDAIEQNRGSAPGSVSFLDVVAKGFDIGGKILAAGNETKEVFLERFLGEFSKEFGGGLGKGASDVVTAIGSLAYAELASKGRLTADKWMVRFGISGSVAGPDVDTQLDEIIQAIQKRGADANCSINVSGHTDTVGSDSSNRILSERRANTVANRIEAAFPGIKVHDEGWGERRLDIMTDNDVADIDNRRVEIELTCRQ